MEPNVSINYDDDQLQHIAEQIMIDDELFRSFEDDELRRSRIIENKIRQINEDELARYRPLYRAIREHNWKAVEDLVNNDPEALYANITEFGQNIFHLLGQFDDAIGLVEKFVLRVPPESLERENVQGVTALVIAAVSGNTKAAKAFVGRHEKLLSVRHGKDELLPIHAAAISSRKETVEYLISVTAEVEDLAGECGSMLLKILIRSNLFGTALSLLKQYPELARDDRKHYWRSNFDRMARKPMIFAGGNRLGFWQSFIYNYIPLQEEKNPYPLPTGVDGGDIEKQTDTVTNSSAESVPSKFLQIAAKFGELRNKLNITLWNVLMH
ncbi:hypothetical protein ACOSQ4_020299 [Xanthoceras sorbifolium]